MHPASVNAGLLYQTVRDFLTDGNIIVALGEDSMAPAFLLIKYLNGICQYSVVGLCCHWAALMIHTAKLGIPRI